MHRPLSRPMFSIGGAIKKSGGTRKLAKGQFAIVDSTQATPEGAKILNSFAGIPKKDKKLTLRMGVSPDRTVTRSRTNKPEESMPFALYDIESLKVEVPQTTVQEFDEVVIGWDGITPGSEFDFRTGDSYLSIAVEVSGEPISFQGGGTDSEVAIVRVEIPSCDPLENCVDCDGCADVDCKPIIQNAVERLRRKQITGGRELGELIDIIPVFDCASTTDVLTPYTFYTLELCDTGTDGALALVQAQYPTYNVVRVGRSGSTTTYQILIPTSEGAPDDYSYTANSIMKDCADCPAGYTESPGGHLYVFTRATNGSTASTAITGLTGYVSSSVVLQGNDNGVLSFTALFTDKLSESDISTYVAHATSLGSGTVDYIGVVSDVCNPDAAVETAWEEGNSCDVSAETYQIILPDTRCGENRLEELQTRYPDLTITIADHPTKSVRGVTLTGTSGTANINVDGLDYLATFNTDLTTTAANFVTTHAENLEVAGITVTSNGATILFEGLTATVTAITITNATTNLAGNIVAVVPAEYREACSTVYETTVVTNLVCDECDPIFKDFFESEAPEMYMNTEWTKETSATEYPTNCKCGIRFKAKPFVISSEEALRCYGISFMETSARIRVSADFPEEIREGIGRIPEGVKTGRYLSTRRDRTFLGGNLRHIEAEGHAYFLDTPSGKKSYLDKVLNGGLSNIEDDFTQYVQYKLVINPKKVGGISGFINDLVEYQIWAPLGRHIDIESTLNSMASAAGIEPVQATAF